MQKLIHIIAGVIVIGFSACDDMLEIDPISEIPVDSYYNNEQQVYTGLIGVYHGMHKPLENEWMLTEVRSDNAVQQSPGSTNETSLIINDLALFRPVSTTPHIYDYWYASYKNINSANTLLENMDVVSDPIQRDRYAGEARFIRAYHYFNLVRLFGPLFIVTEPVSPLQARKINRSPIEDVYELIISDLKFGTEHLPESHRADQLGRVTSWAAKAMLAKVYITLHDYELAKPLLTDVKDNSPHRLLDNYGDVFSISNEMNEEILFAVRYKSGGHGLGSPFANLYAPSQSGSFVINGDGNGYNYPAPSFMNAYESGDARKAATVSVWNNRKNYVKKFMSDVSIRFDAENDFPVLRYADVLLLLAEVYNEGDNDPGTAVPFINQVRVRANLLPLAEDIGKNACRLAIESERRFELAFENQRWFDLVRTNRAQEVVKDQIFNKDWTTHYMFYPPSIRPKEEEMILDWQLLLPIPQREIDTNNEITIIQNSGY